MGDWMHELLLPPPEMAARRSKDNQDPIYMHWALSVTDKYWTIINDAEQQQEDSIQYRQKHPLPETQCNK
jgi:hypothetical protein